MVVSWIIIAILIVLVLVFFKLRHFKHRVFAILIILLIIFFYLTVSKVISGKDLNLRSFEGILAASKLYFSWLWHAALNVKDITANVIKDIREMNWQGNSTSTA